MMKEIRLEPAIEYGHKAQVDVLDYPNGTEAEPRRRCGITVEYGWRDIRRMHEEGMSREDMLDHYRQHIYDLVRINISQDWTCTGGMEEVLEIVGKHIDQELNK